VKPATHGDTTSHKPSTTLAHSSHSANCTIAAAGQKIVHVLAGADNALGPIGKTGA
jgi:hypothetical protein